MIHIRHFPLVRSEFPDVFLTDEFNETPQRGVKTIAHLFVSRIITTGFAEPIEMKAAILNLNHPVAVFVLDLQAAGRILRQLQSNSLGPASRFLKTLELRRQRRDILDDGPFTDVEGLPERSQMCVAKTGQAIELHAQNRLDDRRVFVIGQRVLWRSVGIGSKDST